MESPLSPDTTTRILMVGDMHLGRRPAGLPSEVDPSPFRPAAALSKVVETALDLDVDAVAFAGDLVDGDNDLFEAFTPLSEAAGRLLERNIVVAAVAGNHDTRVLPRLADNLSGELHLLGRGGTWSSCQVRGGAPLPVRLVGWSFPRPHWSRTPLESPPPKPLPGEITLGLLHGDLFDANSNYAPVSRDGLRAAGYAGWFLGHIHRPDPVTDDVGCPFYLGSLTPLDPGETGRHGPVLVTIDASGGIAARRLPLAPLRWEHTELSCTDLDDPAAGLGNHILRFLLDRIRDGDHPAAMAGLGFRLTITGRVARPAEVRAAVAQLASELPRTDEGGVMAFVEKIRCAVTGRHDLTALARGDDPAGLLARAILALRDDPQGDRATELMQKAEGLMVKLGNRPEYTLLDPGRRRVDPETLRRITMDQALRLLDALAGPEGGGHGTA